jgi:hypothetical protein
MRPPAGIVLRPFAADRPVSQECRYSPILRELAIVASARVRRQQLADTWAQPARRVRCEGRRFDAEAGTLKIAATWPWATAIITAWKPIQALPLPSLVTPLTMAAQTGIGIP